MSSWNDGTTSAEAPGYDWLLTHGADMAWHYAFEVVPLLVDLGGAKEAGDWPLCTEIGAALLRAMAECEHRAAGIGKPVPDSEFQARLATDASEAARTLRQLPVPAAATQSSVADMLETLTRLDAELQGRLPFDVPLIRSSESQGRSMRLSASIIRLRAERGLGMPDWNPASDPAGGPMPQAAPAQRTRADARGRPLPSSS